MRSERCFETGQEGTGFVIMEEQVELNYPYNDIAASDTLKMQLAYDHEKFSR